MNEEDMLDFLRRPDFQYNSPIINVMLKHHENISEDDVLIFSELKGLENETYSLVASFIRQGKVYTGTCFIGDAAGRAAFSSAMDHSNFQFCHFLEEWKPIEPNDNAPSVPIGEQEPVYALASESVSNSGQSAEVFGEALFRRVSNAIMFGNFQSQMGKFFSEESFERIKIPLMRLH